MAETTLLQVVYVYAHTHTHTYMVWHGTCDSLR